MKEYITRKENNIKQVKFLSKVTKTGFQIKKKPFEIGVIVEFRDKSLAVIQSNGSRVGIPQYNCISDYQAGKKHKEFDISLLEWSFVSRVFIFSSGEIKEGEFSLTLVTNTGEKIEISNKVECEKKRILLLAEISNVDNRVNLCHLNKKFFNESEMSIEHGIRVVWSKIKE